MSNIKGGGRAALSDSAEEALISLLMPSNDNIRSEHDRKREHKRFLKTLVERYERQKLANTLNNNSETTSLPRSCGNKKNYATAKQKQQSDAKVRVELVEAVYGKDNKKGKHSDSFFKDGTKKAMVFPISTTVAELIKQAQSKLRMKKPPIRAFVKENKIDRALSMDLTGDLSGVQNGAIIYVTSTASSPKGEDKINNVQVDDSMPDPLDAVKQAYNARRNYHRHNRRQTRARTTLEHPSFSDHFDKLIQLSEERANLPAASCREHILRSVQDNRVVVICGATGCGKSTQVPQFLFEGMTAAGQGQDANILVTQPRRVAAISLAQRVSCEIKDSAAPGKPGSQVGYNVRLDRAVTNDAKIVYCTVGILLRMLVCPQEEADEDGTNDNVPLSNLSHVVIDEVHERDVNTDFVLTLLRALLRRNRHIRIILMSATASASLFVNYFVGHLEKAPVVIDIPGRSFPVNIKWLSDCENFASSRIQFYNDDIEEKNNVPSRVQSGDSDGVVLSPRATDKIDNQFIRKLICAIVREEQQRTTGKQSTAPSGKRTDGAILVFLPGKGEIEALGKVLIDDSTLGHQDVCKILKLHSTIPRGGQQVVFQPALEGTVKIVLATNIAETSITIPGRNGHKT